MARLLRYRAGRTALSTLRDEGLTAHGVGAIAGPASGPKWIVLAGLDRALLESGLLEASPGATRVTGSAPPARPLLVGASAGAWRMMALASRDPRQTQRRLLEGYTRTTFTGRPPPALVSQAYRQLLSDLFPPAEVDWLGCHPRFDLAIHVVRSRSSWGWSGMPRIAQTVHLGLAGLLHSLSPEGTDLVFERVLFHTRPRTFKPKLDGRLVVLDHRNLGAVMIATGTVPIYMEPLRDLPGAPPGPYLDGGLSDYHLRQRYVADRRSIVLFPHFQRRVVPAWFDRRWIRRVPRTEAIDNVLQIHPSEDFLARLPDGRLPDRNDFFRFADDPSERIRRWKEASRHGEDLGRIFLDDLASGRIPENTEPLCDNRGRGGRHP